MVLGFFLQAGTDPFIIFVHILHLLGVWVAVNFTEEDSSQYCPRIYLLGGGVPYGDWGVFFVPGVNPYPRKGVRCCTTGLHHTSW